MYYISEYYRVACLSTEMAVRVSTEAKTKTGRMKERKEQRALVAKIPSEQGAAYSSSLRGIAKKAMRKSHSDRLTMYMLVTDIR